jgi:hypothetical protein
VKLGKVVDLDYRCGDRKKVDQLRVDIGAIIVRSRLPLPKISMITPKERTIIQAGEGFEDITFKVRFEIVVF